MDKLYCKVLVWSIMRLVNRQKTYQARCKRLNQLVNWLVDVYSDYSKEVKKHVDFNASKGNY